MAMNDDDPEVRHEYVRILVQREQIRPRWVALLQVLLMIALIIVSIAVVIALFTGNPWTRMLSAVLNVITIVLLGVATVLFLRTGFVIKRDQQETARLETRMYKTYLDLKVQNDRAGLPPLPPPPDL
jgi:phosphoglycerol transferase MdoB-like AlkP superfamily enzyme